MYKIPRVSTRYRRIPSINLDHLKKKESYLLADIKNKSLNSYDPKMDICLSNTLLMTPIFKLTSNRPPIFKNAGTWSDSYFPYDEYLRKTGS